MLVRDYTYPTPESEQARQLALYKRLLEGIAEASNVLLTHPDYRYSIDQALAILGNATQVDRVYIFETHPHPHKQTPAMSQRWEWCAPGVPEEIDNPTLQNLPYKECFPRWYTELANKRPIVGLVKNFPTAEKELLEPQGILSILVVPIYIKNHFWGFIGFDQCQHPHQWSEVERSTLRAIAGSFGGTIARHQAEQNLQELNRNLESRIQARTQDLSQTNQALSSTLKTLKATQSQLIHTEKMSSLGQLVGGIAHEINNPANFIDGNLMHARQYMEEIMGLVELYQQAYPKPTDPIQKALIELDIDFLNADFAILMQSIKEGIDRITHLVKSLRNFARHDEAAYKTVDIHRGIESTLDFLQHRFRATDNTPAITLTKHYDEHLPKVACYPGALNQVLMNILSNALDALSDKSAGDRSQRPDAIAVRTQPLKNQRILISIQDNGNGIPPQKREKIFDPFYTSKPVGQGTGLGLSIAHQIIVKQHHGSIHCDSTLGQGTTFTLILPIQAHEPSASNEKG